MWLEQLPWSDNQSKSSQSRDNAIGLYGTSCTGSRFLNGNMTIIEDLRASTGGNGSAREAAWYSRRHAGQPRHNQLLIGKDDTVILDKKTMPASSTEPVWAYKADRALPPQRCWASRAGAQACPMRGKLLVVDGLFSMESDIAPLPEITLCEQYGVRLMVDDAHAMGVLGEGRGTAAHFGVTDHVDASCPPSASPLPQLAVSWLATSRRSIMSSTTPAA